MNIYNVTIIATKYFNFNKKKVNKKLLNIGKLQIYNAIVNRIRGSSVCIFFLTPYIPSF
jgi:hypothetical protein